MDFVKELCPISQFKPSYLLFVTICFANIGKQSAYVGSLVRVTNKRYIKATDRIHDTGTPLLDTQPPPASTPMSMSRQISRRSNIIEIRPSLTPHRSALRQAYSGTVANTTLHPNEAQFHAPRSSSFKPYCTMLCRVTNAQLWRHRRQTSYRKVKRRKVTKSESWNEARNRTKNSCDDRCLRATWHEHPHQRATVLFIHAPAIQTNLQPHDSNPERVSCHIAVAHDPQQCWTCDTTTVVCTRHCAPRLICTFICKFVRHKTVFKPF